MNCFSLFSCTIRGILGIFSGFLAFLPTPVKKIFLSRFPCSNKYFPENPSCDWSRNKQLHRKRHNEVSAISHQIIRNKLIGESIAVIYAQDASQCHLRHNRKNLNRKNNRDWPVIRLNNTKCKLFRNMAGYKIRTQENDHKLDPHSL